MTDSRPVRVRFAPSPTGGLHLGGVRTVLYNYLFARQHNGTFVLRIEDTDQTRFVTGAEEYILNCLEWCGLSPDESVAKPGLYGPYRQSERKSDYWQYADLLIESGHAYYAFDTPEELDAMRETFKTADNPSPQYDRHTRMQMRNSLSLGAEATQTLLDDGTPYVVRVKMPSSGTVAFNDAVRGEVRFDLALVDDKVLLKRDGMPTYHLAVVVDDYLMEITHAFRGEEWLPSAPVHVFLWEALGWNAQMPQWAHLPLILGPDGAKLSKRHGAKYGFPIFAMNWTDPKTGEPTEGFRERGFLPEAFLNSLALLGWNDGSGDEIFTLPELIAKFSLDRVAASGAVFDYEKAKWVNQQHLLKLSDADLVANVKPFLETSGLQASDADLLKVLPVIKERCHLLSDFYEQCRFFFQAPEAPDADALRAKWTDKAAAFFESYATVLEAQPTLTESEAAAGFEAALAAAGIKKGEAMLPLRVMLVGGKFGPDLFFILSHIGGPEAAARIRTVRNLLS
ncbi:MAG: glutamate--tRNA ligase [Sphingobacteriales bacterium]|nr:MAG: glutamate--tRNA ligase [Sphingobacteriales bacterium]